MAPDERRRSILDATVPLLMEHGAEVTTRQIADAAGIAEGTVFRVFADKQDLIDAAVARFMDPAVTIEALAAIDTQLDVEAKVRALVDIMLTRFSGVVGIMTALGLRQPVGVIKSPEQRDYAKAVAHNLFDRERDHLRMDPSAAVRVIRHLCFAATFPSMAGETTTTPEEIVEIVLHGITTKEA
jgi:AcrR family transcriptional regulator